MRGPRSKMCGAITSTRLSFGGTQFRAAGSPVLDNLVLFRQNRPLCQNVQTLVISESLLHDPILKRMKTNCNDPPGAAKTSDCAVKSLTQRAELVVDGDTQSLKDARTRSSRRQAMTSWPTFSFGMARNAGRGRLRGRLSRDDRAASRHFSNLRFAQR